jgi:hypothetical protein
MSGTIDVLAQNELARFFLRIEVQRMPIIGWGSGGYIGNFGLPADSSGQQIPGLHLSVAHDPRGERAIGT